MTLIGIRGNSKLVNRKLILYGFEKAPSLILDCSNSANPHAFFPETPLEKFHLVHVMEVELLYKFRDILKILPSITNKLETKTVVITIFNALFNYQNEDENEKIYAHCWKLIRQHSKTHDIYVGIHKSQEEKWATLSGARGLPRK